MLVIITLIRKRKMKRSGKKRERHEVYVVPLRGECKWGDACKFSHDEQRCANTGWGDKDRESRWNHDKYDEPPKSRKNFSQWTSDPNENRKAKEGDPSSRSVYKSSHSSRSEPNNDEDRHHRKSKRGKYSERWSLEGDQEYGKDTRGDKKRHKHGRESSTRHRSREDEESHRRTRT